MLTYLNIAPDFLVNCKNRNVFLQCFLAEDLCETPNELE